MKKFKFIAIDSSLANTGIAIGEIDQNRNVKVHAIGLNETIKSKNKQIRASSDTISRGRQTHTFIHSLLESVQPDFVFVETPSGSQSSAGMKSYGMTCQLIAGLDPKPIEVTPDEVKKASVGKKTASKKEMMDWAYGLFPDLEWFVNKSTGKLQNKNEHMADGIAIVYAGIKTDDFVRVFEIINK
jgi:Holliday junction resolvasome RuvABC endonuclease subunit